MAFSGVSHDDEGEWFDGGSETGSSHLSLLGRDVSPQLGDRVMLLRPVNGLSHLGTIVELRMAGTRVKVQHDGSEKAERYYNTGKDGSFQLALPPERHLGWLPRPPGREEPKVRPRYSERRSVSGGRSPSISSQPGRSRYSELRKARRSQAISDIDLASTLGDRLTAPEWPAAGREGDDGSEPATPRGSRYSERRKSRSPVRCPPPAEASGCAETPLDLCQRLERLERTTAGLSLQLEEMAAEKERRGLKEASQQQAELTERIREEGRRQLESFEERLAELRDETRKRLEALERQICSALERKEAPEPEEPEQESVPEEPLVRGMELADSELSLQTIGSIARRVSASLGGPKRASRPKEAKERNFDFEKEMEHMADMRRFASQVGMPNMSYQQVPMQNAWATNMNYMDAQGQWNVPQFMPGQSFSSMKPRNFAAVWNLHPDTQLQEVRSTLALYDFYPEFHDVEPGSGCFLLSFPETWQAASFAISLDLTSDMLKPFGADQKVRSASYKKETQEWSKEEVPLRLRSQLQSLM